MKAQYAILRFAKYKGPEIGHIEAHNERKKETYASNPDVDTSKSDVDYGRFLLRTFCSSLGFVRCVNLAMYSCRPASVK